MRAVVKVTLVFVANIRDRVILDELTDWLTVFFVVSFKVGIELLRLLLGDVVRISLLSQKQVDVMVLTMLCYIALAADFSSF